jgi:Ala-tRNA(Pro) deacylase
MGIAITLKDYLSKKGTQYEVLTHPRALSSLEVAATAHVSGDCLAKTVILEDDNGYLMAVLPATHRVRIGMLRKQLNRNLRLASEFELADLFKDCDLGAIPPVGQAYGLETVLAPDLAQQSDIYFEAGDHQDLIHVTGNQFQELMSGAIKRQFTCHV